MGTHGRGVESADAGSANDGDDCDDGNGDINAIVLSD